MTLSQIVVGITSCAKHSDRRDACRETWIAELTRAGVPHFFALGRGVVTAHEDEVSFDVGDSYGELPQKTWSMVAYTQPVYGDGVTLFKCDDDTFVHVPRFLRLFQEIRPSYRGYGLLIDPKRSNDRYASGGAGYFLPSDAMRMVIRSSSMKSTSGAEDRIVGKILRDAGILLFNDRRFSPWGRQMPRGDNDLITGHYVRPPQMRELHGADPLHRHMSDRGA